jgi:hypothetical protein
MKYFIEKPLAFVGFVTQKQKYALRHAKSTFGLFTKSPPVMATLEIRSKKSNTDNSARSF